MQEVTTVQCNGLWPLHPSAAIGWITMPESTLEELVTHEHHWDGAAGGVDGPPHARLRARMPLASPPNPVHKVPVQLALAVTLPVFATPNLIVRAQDAGDAVEAVVVAAWKLGDTLHRLHPLVGLAINQLDGIKVGEVEPLRMELRALDGFWSLWCDFRHKDLAWELLPQLVIDVLQQAPWHVVHAVHSQAVHVVLLEPHARGV
mmetsp:Transcript_4777/g.8999  ORF Transcript_4777/g.8999 Transcript_4777/m.8999 type:complete len:204 (-) Transcript_4777:1102-1713(-)